MTQTAYVEVKGGPWCKACGHPLVLRSLSEALERLGLAPADVAVVTDIGCVGLADSQILTPHTVHTTHGRSTAFATGMSLADAILGPGRLKPIVLIGFLPAWRRLALGLSSVVFMFVMKEKAGM